MWHPIISECYPQSFITNFDKAKIYFHRFYGRIDCYERKINFCYFNYPKCKIYKAGGSDGINLACTYIIRCLYIRNVHKTETGLARKYYFEFITSYGLCLWNEREEFSKQ